VTKFGQGGGRGNGNGNGEEHEPTRITVKDKRRIDPATGEVRDAPAGVPQPGSDAANPGDPANATGPVTATVVDSAELDAARAEAAERTADLQRITAEYANYRKRADRDKQAAAAAGKAAVVAELLAVLDDLDRAEEHGDLTGGFKTVADKLTGILQRVGLTHYGAPGDEFDPNIHEAVQFATSAEVDHPTVTTVLRLGYLFEERVLRPAVVVVTGPEHESEGAGDAAASDAGASGAAAADAGASDEGAGAGSDGAARAAGSNAGVSDAGASEAGASGGETADAAK
jgi:molecular chaperone GrpE